MAARTFAKVLRSFGYAEHLFNSRSEPMFKLFNLLPVAIDALCELGDAWSAELLHKFSGAVGYEHIVNSAVLADVMMVLQTATHCGSCLSTAASGYQRVRAHAFTLL